MEKKNKCVYHILLRPSQIRGLQRIQLRKFFYLEILLDSSKADSFLFFSYYIGIEKRSLI